MKQLLLICAVVALVGGCVSTPVVITNPDVEAAIRAAAKKPTGELTQADFEKVTKLNLEHKKLTSVKGLEKLTQLKALDLSGNQLTDVKGLVFLTQLKRLYLNDNPDLTKAQIDQLKKALPNCKIYSNLPLTKEESAKVIEAAIRKAAKKPTGELTEADLEKVTRLSLIDEQLTDVKGLEKLTQLTILNLRDNQLTDVKGLEKLTQLKGLNLKDNPDLTKAQIDRLKKALPNCKIYSNAKK